MSLFLCFVRAPFKLALLNWMPLDKYWINKPRLKFQQSHSPEQTRLFRTTPPLWNLTSAGYPKCIPVVSPVPVQQADAHPDGSPLKNIAGSMGAGLFPPRAFFFKYFHWFLSGNPRVQSVCGTGLFCDVSGTNVQKTPRSPWNKWALDKLTALNNKALTLTFPSSFFVYRNGPRDHISCAK